MTYGISMMGETNNMFNETIIDNGNQLKSCLEEKQKLQLAHFFNSDNLNYLFEILEFNNQLKSYLSTLTINDNYIKATFRKTYFKKFNFSFDSINFYNMINESLLVLLQERSDMLELTDEELNAIYTNISNLYTITRPNDNTIILSF